MYEAKQQGDALYSLARKLDKRRPEEAPLKEYLQNIERQLYLQAILLDGAVVGKASQTQAHLGAKWRSHYDSTLAAHGMSIDWNAMAMLRGGAIVAQADAQWVASVRSGKTKAISKDSGGRALQLCSAILNSMATVYGADVPESLREKPGDTLRAIKPRLPRSLTAGTPSFMETLEGLIEKAQSRSTGVQ